MKSFKKGDTIQLWDWAAQGVNRHDVLAGHGQVGVIIRKSRKTDFSDTGEYLDDRARECYQIALPGYGLVNVHREWLRYPPSEKKISNDNNGLQAQ